jgi:TatD DNase family protein
MLLFDSHCHLDAAEFDPDRAAVLAAARAAAVADILIPGVARRAWPQLRDLCRAEPGLHAALGLHPVYLEEHAQADLTILESVVATQPPTAIGEIGLDYFVTGLDRTRQMRLFEAQLAIAGSANLPVILHVRKAHDEVLGVLRRHRIPGGIAHAFNGSLDQAHRYIDLGFKLGFGGMLTYERSRRLRTLARALPAASLVLETDAPDLTPAPYHGTRNEPAYLGFCLTALARLREEDPALVAEYTRANTRAVLGLAA